MTVRHLEEAILFLRLTSDYLGLIMTNQKDNQQSQQQQGAKIYSWDFIWSYILQCSVSRSWLFDRSAISKHDMMYSFANEAFLYKFNSWICIPNQTEKKEISELAIFTSFKRHQNSMLGFGFRKDRILLEILKMITPCPRVACEPRATISSSFQSRTAKTLLQHGGANYMVAMEFIWDDDGALFAGAFSFIINEKVINCGSQPVEINFYESRYFAPNEAVPLAKMSDEMEYIVRGFECESSETTDYRCNSDGFSSFFETNNKGVRFEGRSVGQKIPIANPNAEKKSSSTVIRSPSKTGSSASSNVGKSSAISTVRDAISSSDEEANLKDAFKDTFEVTAPYVSKLRNKRKDTLSLKVDIDVSNKIFCGVLQISIDHPIHRNSLNLFSFNEEEDHRLAHGDVRQTTMFSFSLEAISEFQSDRCKVNNTRVLSYAPRILRKITKPDSKRHTIEKLVKMQGMGNEKEKNGWKCRQCGTLIKGKKSNLNRHIEFVHNKKYDYVCEVDQCRRKFQSVANLKRHIFAVHKEQKLSCADCTRKFKSIDSLHEHVETVHAGGRENYRCDECGGCYSRKMVLERHIKMLHSKP